MSAHIPCPTCGAVGNQLCNTLKGNNHKRRWKAEIAAQSPTKEDEA